MSWTSSTNNGTWAVGVPGNSDSSSVTRTCSRLDMAVNALRFSISSLVRASAPVPCWGSIGGPKFGKRRLMTTRVDGVSRIRQGGRQTPWLPPWHRLEGGDQDECGGILVQQGHDAICSFFEADLHAGERLKERHGIFDDLAADQSRGAARRPHRSRCRPEHFGAADHHANDAVVDESVEALWSVEEFQCGSRRRRVDDDAVECFRIQSSSSTFSEAMYSWVPASVEDRLR